MVARRPRHVPDRKDPSAPHKSWDFTDHALLDQEGTVVQSVFDDWQRWCDNDGASQLEIAAEVGEQGKWHGQGRLILRRAYRRSQLQKLMPGVHFEPTKCMQDCLYLRKATMKTILKYDGRRQGQRNVFKEQKQVIEDGGNIRQCMEMEGANYQSVRAAELMMPYLEPDRPPAPRQVHYAQAETVPHGPDVYRLNDIRFWNGYDGQSVVYINQALLKLSIPWLRMICGPMPFRVGRGRQARHDTVYITGLSQDECIALRVRPQRLDPVDLIVRRL